ncbi:MAG: hypothetical protein E7557_03585 [Ruminococcaceae bacterium]|nr:hypothetical protein [Oscillospiraceae bacterium]
MSEIYEDVIGYLREKSKLLSEVEKITDSMAVVPQEELLGCTEKRGKLVDEIKIIDDKLREFAGMDNDIRSVLNNSCEKDDLTPELSKVYIEVLAVNAVLNRINSNDNVIKNRIEYEREKILNKIQVFNQGGEAATQRYYKSIHGTGGLTTVNVSRDIKI